MTPANRYFRWSKLSEDKFRQVLESFAQDEDASAAARRNGVSVRSVNSIYLRIRRRLEEWSDANAPSYTNLVHVDEQFFGPRSVKGPRGRGAAKKILVLGFFEPGGQVFTHRIPDGSKRTLHNAISQRVSPGTRIITDRWRGYDSLDEIGCPDHCRIERTWDRGDWGPAQGENITTFWDYVHQAIAKFGGVPTRTALLHVKEREFRWNHRNEDLWIYLHEMFLAHPL